MKLILKSNSLKQVLIKHGLSQTELAKHANLSIGTINKICAMKYNASPKTQSRILISLSQLTGKDLNTEEVFEI